MFCYISITISELSDQTSILDDKPVQRVRSCQQNARCNVHDLSSNISVSETTGVPVLTGQTLIYLDM